MRRAEESEPFPGAAETFLLVSNLVFPTPLQSGRSTVWFPARGREHEGLSRDPAEALKVAREHGGITRWN